MIGDTYIVEINDFRGENLMVFAEGRDPQTHRKKVFGVITSSQQVSVELLDLRKVFLGRLGNVTYPDSFPMWPEIHRTLLATAADKNRRGLRV